MVDGTFLILLLGPFCSMLLLIMFVKMNQAQFFCSPGWALFIEIGSTLTFLSAKENINVAQ